MTSWISTTQTRPHPLGAQEPRSAYVCRNGAMDNVTIRKAVPDDRSAIVKLWREMMSFHEKRDPLFAITNGGPERFNEFLTANLSDDTACVLVATVDGNVVGYCHANLEKLPPVFENQDIGLVSELAVGEAHRRRGIGRRLYQEIEAWFKDRGIQRIDVRVAAANEVSTAFWSECGFGEHVMTVNKRI